MFFSDDVGIEFSAFSFVHILLFIGIILGSTLIFIFRKRIREWKHERQFAKTVAILAFVWELLLYLWYIVNGIWTPEHSLPIGLCAFVLYIGIFSLYFKNYKLFAVGYFWTWGAIASVLFPDIAFSYDRFRFYQFMLGHMNFFWMFLYMIFVYKWYPNWQDWKRSCITLSIIVLILIITSNITNANLMFMLRSDGTPFEIFEGYGYAVYLIGVISLSFIVIFIWFLPFMLYHRRNKKIEN